MIIPYSMRAPVIKLQQPFKGCRNQTTDAVCNATYIRCMHVCRFDETTGDPLVFYSAVQEAAGPDSRGFPWGFSLAQTVKHS